MADSVRGVLQVLVVLATALLAYAAVGRRTLAAARPGRFGAGSGAPPALLAPFGSFGDATLSLTLLLLGGEWQVLLFSLLLFSE